MYQYFPEYQVISILFQLFCAMLEQEKSAMSTMDTDNLIEEVDKRRFIRHPTDIPIAVEQDLSGFVADPENYLNDISYGGLSFRSNQMLARGMALLVCIPLVDPEFQIRGVVAWCRPNSGGFDAGVEFIEPEKFFKARMVEQICHIEHYRREIHEQEGRELSGEEAALEWIRKYAREFPKL